MFNINKDLNKIREINGIRDSLIPFLISYLSQNQNIFYVAKNDLELSNVYKFLYLNFKEINKMSLKTTSENNFIKLKKF